MSIDEVKPIEVLLVEDDPGDVVLITEAFEHNKVNNRLTVVSVVKLPEPRVGRLAELPRDVVSG
jgi:hypothetical protein